MKRYRGEAVKRILLHSETGDFGVKLNQILTSTIDASVKVSNNQETTKSLVKNRFYDLLVIETEALSSVEAQFLRQIRRKGYEQPILSVAKEIKLQNFDEVHASLQFQYLQNPVQRRQLIGLTLKLLSLPQCPQQMFRRFQTVQEVELEGLISGESKATQMLNLSKGGAYCELLEEGDLQEGDLFRLKINLNDLEKEHTLHAKAVWVRNKGGVTGYSGVGLQFLDPQEIHRQLRGTV